MHMRNPQFELANNQRYFWHVLIVVFPLGLAPLATAEDDFGSVVLRRAPPECLILDSGHKPAVPERPATLQRPLSSSFRLNRPPSDLVSAITSISNSTHCSSDAHSSGNSSYEVIYLAFLVLSLIAFLLLSVLCIF